MDSREVSATAHRYTAQLAGQIEEKWQDRWDAEGTFNADNPTGDLAGPLAEKERYFLLDMFPYPSGKGLHVGHPLGYIATDVVGRYQRMCNKNVLYTLGYDAFGLPAEQYAVQTGQHPRITTEENIANMERQLRRIGLSHDKRRSFATTDDDYVRWTQWIFLQIFNSFYDPKAPRRDGGTGSARPITELVAEFASGTREIPGHKGKNWDELSVAEQNLIIDEHRLAYVSSAPVNWCPGLGTVLANEEVTADGRSERGNYPVFASRLRQWMMRITAYADRLAEDLDSINWPDTVRSMQRNWIGKSVGATVTFTVEEPQTAKLDVFTTRPDTLFGATFMVVAPEHDLLGDLEKIPSQWPANTREEWKGGHETPRDAVTAYQQWAKERTDEERTADGTTKTGVFTGIFAINPVNGKPTPIFVADYVLMGYGTGAIMAVPAHDERDFAFADKFNIDKIITIEPDQNWEEGTAWVGDGLTVNSANDLIDLNGLDKASAKTKITAWLEEQGLGQETTTYRLRDWLFSRQRYWGEPFPVVYDEAGKVHALPESMLPVTLPELDDFSPRTFDPEDADSSPEPPLGRAQEWLEVELDLGEGLKTYRRDSNTMPNWAGSCWYELRYLDPHNDQALVDPENERYWMGSATGGAGGAGLYVGGVEHAVLHLLYARFWHKVLFDLGHVSSSEPFHTLFNQGYIQAYAFKDARGQYVPADEVEGDEEAGWTWQGQPVSREYGKMGKSLKNIVTPDDMCETYGADTFRVYEMSMGPLDVSRPWDTRAVVGSQRFLQRLWRNVVDEVTGQVTVVDEAMDDKTARLVARTIVDVREEYDHMRINTAIAKMIVLNNHLTGYKQVSRAAIESLILMAAPVAPHIAEELWAKLGHENSLARESFPEVTDLSLLEEEAVVCVVQISGKVRARLEVAPSIGADELQELALDAEPIKRILQGQQPLKVIVRAPKVVNIVLPKNW